MGITYIEGKVKGFTGKEEKVKFLIDSGDSYSLLPLSVWKKIELSAKREMSFTLADGTTVKRTLQPMRMMMA